MHIFMQNAYIYAYAYIYEYAFIYAFIYETCMKKKNIIF